MAPKDFVDDVSQNFRDLLGLLNISNDKFIRTTEEDHMSAVKVSESILLSSTVNIFDLIAQLA
jgi:methionyl-tRNA synthetase